MRAFDNWNFYFDNKKNLLHGKISFCKKGTTEPITIYNSDGVAIRNPSFTSSLGRTEYQVFLDDDVDVTAYCYRYIGTGNMTDTEGEDYSPNRWEYLYSINSLAFQGNVEIETNDIVSVNSIAELRALNVAYLPITNGQRIVMCNGYYSAGDTSPVVYVWDENSLLADDGGSVIAATSVTSNGRWILATKELQFDVRHFGVMPTNDIYSNDYTYTSQLSNCAKYINSVGCDAWFPALSNDLSYYLFDGSNTFVINTNIYISRNVRFVCKDDTNGTRIECKKLIKDNLYLFDSSVKIGSAMLIADELRISWLGGMVQGIARLKYVIDTDEFQRIIQQKKVEFIANGHPSLQLINCDIESNKRITGDIAITDSVIKTSFFADDYDYSQLLIAGCSILLDNCKDVNTYVLLKNKQQESDYGNLNGQEISNVTLLENAFINNALLSNVTITGHCELENVRGSIIIQGSGNTINAIDCHITLASAAVLGAVVFKGGAIACNEKLSFLKELIMENAVINTPMEVLGGNLSLKNCDINKLIEHKGSGTITEAVIGCAFNERIAISASAADTVVNAVWINNHSNVYTPIVFDRTNIAANDSAHSYVYEGNSGKFTPAKETTITYTLTTSYNGDSFGKLDNYITWLNGMLHFADLPLDRVEHGLSAYVNFFRIGVNDFVANIRWNVLSSIDQHLKFLTAPLEFSMKAKRVGDDSYKLCVNVGEVNDTETIYMTPIGLCNTQPTEGSKITALMTISLTP